MTKGIVKELLKTTRNKKEKHNKTIMLTNSKLNCIESKRFKAVINNKFGHEDFITIINKAKHIPELKKIISMMKRQNK